MRLRAAAAERVADDPQVAVDARRAVAGAGVVARLHRDRAEVRGRSVHAALLERAAGDLDVLGGPRLEPPAEVRRNEDGGQREAAERAALDTHVPGLEQESARPRVLHGAVLDLDGREVALVRDKVAGGDPGGVS